MNTTKNRFLLPLILITSLFFLWGFAHNLNPILIPHLKKACQLNNLQSSLVDSAFFIGYFLMALPAGMVMKRYGYKSGILLGLLLFALGAFLFYPAAEARVFGLFLTALFIIASGLTFLETAANPYIMVLGDADGATQRLNFSQSFNGLAAFLAPIIGGRYILSGKTLTAQESAAMTPDALNAYLNKEAASVQLPYIIIGAVVLLVAVILWRTHLPEIKEEEVVADTTVKTRRSVFSYANLNWGLLAQFCYVGAQVCMVSFFIRFAETTAGMEEKSAAEYLGVAGGLFMAGRFIGTFLMKYVAPARLLLLYGIANIILLSLAIANGGMVAVYALIAVSFFMSIMFPTIFSLTLSGLDAETRKKGSSLLVMTIVGGAIFPVIMARIIDTQNIRIAYIVPAIGFLVVAWFAFRNVNNKSVVVSASH
ncbi:L-fucose:H+ symporter permease [Filimonas effusa]|uniref:L-fucose:H+ symporter permease n=1 Tax=Filimonas effusa TaxID=2508721 RepID=A0A4Q1DCL2_9BACT|nr:L-fucose:H+ symporter permease [Filimonas effusa]RXK87264.1 L-fucose:H+ symporter permease [Filimonas effusa]